MRTTDTKKIKMLTLDYIVNSTQRLKRIEKLIFVEKINQN